MHVLTAINLQVPQKPGDFLINWAIIYFSTRTSFYGI
jgi:hypothetical protein